MADVDIDIIGAELPALSTVLYGGDSVIGANLPRLSAIVSVDSGTATSLEAVLPSLEATLTTGNRVTVTLQALESVVSVDVPCSGYIKAELRALGATAFSGSYIESQLSKLSATVEVEVSTLGEVAPILPRLSATVHTDIQVNGEIKYTLKPLSVALAGAGISISDDSVSGVITGALHILKAEMESIGSADIDFAPELPSLESCFNGMIGNNISLTGTLPALGSSVLQQQSYTYSDADFTRTC